MSRDASDDLDLFAETAVPPTRADVDLGPASISGIEGFDRYERRSLLGEGGMGEVWLCRDPRIGREIALKVVKRSNDDAFARFIREARVQGQLEHPAIVPVYDIGRGKQGEPYFTMKRVRGVSLDRVLRRLRAGDVALEKELSERKLLTAFSQICLAVDFAHQRGVIHRDLKPSNVMLGEFGEVSILDWGVARIIGTPERDPSSGGADVPSDSFEANTREGRVIGTVGYMAPEQARGEIQKLDGRSDVYSLGAILFEILTLVPLHPGETMGARLYSTVEGGEARPSVRAPERDVPPELERICLRATAFDPDERFPSAGELARAIEAFLDGDRDLELRRDLSAKHADRAAQEAERALEGDQEARTRSLREVGRALAFNPENVKAMSVLVRLLSTPPAEEPPEVRAALEETLYTQRRVGAGAFYGYIVPVLMAPLFWWMGVRSWTLLAMFCAVFLLVAALNFTVTRMRRPSTMVEIGASLAGAIATVSLMLFVGPLILVPAAITAHVSAFAITPHRRNRVIHTLIHQVIFLSAVALEWSGALPQQYAFTGGAMQVLPKMTELPELPVRILLTIAVVDLIASPAIILGSLRDSLTDAERRLHLHTWQLRQLIPQGPGAVPAPGEPG